jgi:thiamine-phosphate pyrophosphorylase
MIPSRHENRFNWGLYVITEADQSRRSHLEYAHGALEGGARVIQLRDKNTSFEKLLLIAREMRALTHRYGAQLIINDNPYLAREVEADGVHIGQFDFAADISREILGPDKIIGLSTHTKQQAMAAQYMPVDYIGVGPVYATGSKVSEWPVVGTRLIRWIRQNVQLPLVAIGGITEERIVDVIAAGADNVAVIGELASASDLTGKTRALIDAIASASQEEEVE